jgi:mRNA-degrading endonuclease RelE of RelBE toxin-antitoxin system
MTYKLDFHPDALKEWGKLDESVKGQFKKKLKERLEQPEVPSTFHRINAEGSGPSARTPVHLYRNRLRCAHINAPQR